ncbi:MAG: hypothetical protein GEV13_13855 [Rhodospirillales bacterium]|nr:hypothetical protein [Rhodospirillales bacterium]
MFNLPFGPMDPSLLTEILRQRMQSPGQIPGPLAAVELKAGYRPPSGGMPGMPEPRSVPGFNIDAGLDALSVGLAKWKPKPRDPGEQAQRAAIAADPAVQANPATSAAGMLAGTNPDLGLVPGSVAANQPLDGGSGVGTRRMASRTA